MIEDQYSGEAANDGETAEDKINTGDTAQDGETTKWNNTLRLYVGQREPVENDDGQREPVERDDGQKEPIKQIKRECECTTSGGSTDDDSGTDEISGMTAESVEDGILSSARYSKQDATEDARNASIGSIYSFERK